MNSIQASLMGTEVIYCGDYGRRPEVKKIVKVTHTTGRIKVEGFSNYWNPKKNGAGVVLQYLPESDPGVVKRGFDQRLYPYSQEKMEELNKKAEQYEQRLAQKRAEEVERQAQRKLQHDNEMNEAKAACGGVLPEFQLQRILLDGSRFCVFDVPMKPLKFADDDKPEYRAMIEEQRKNAFCTAIVRLVNEKRFDRKPDGEYGNVDHVEAYCTYARKDGHSFPSCSGISGADDNEALWEVVQDLYHSW